MGKRLGIALFALGGLALLGAGAAWLRPSASLKPAEEVVVKNLRRLPLSFEPNVGEAPDTVDLVARSGDARVLLGPGHLTVVSEGRALTLNLVGAKDSRFQGVERLPGTANYFLGNRPEKWRTNVPTYAKAVATGVYPNIDWVVHGDAGTLEYDFWSSRRAGWRISP